MDIVLYVMDALRADYLSCYGYDKATSPRLDELCEDSVRFENAVAPAPWTKPSAVSLLTGLYPRSLDVMHEDSFLQDFEKTLPRVLGQEGYKTLGASANAFVSPYFGFDGFDTFHTLLQEDELIEKRRQAKEPEGKTADRLELLDVDKPIVPLSEDINDRIIPSLTNEQDTSTFALAWSVDTHGPYFVRGDRSVFGNDLDEFIYEQDVDRSNLDTVTSLYEDMIRYNDRQLGELIDALKQEGSYDDTLLIVVGDHGEAFGDHTHLPGKPVYGHGGIPYEEKIHVPTIIKFPENVQAGEVVETPISLVDIFPTILDCAGITPSMELQGESLTSPETLDSDRTVFVESQFKSDGLYAASVHKKDYKYLTIDYEPTSYGSLNGLKESLKTNVKRLSHGTENLFDLASDPGETHDVSDENPAVRDSLQTALEKYRTESDELAQNLVTGETQTNVDEDVKDRLKTLGYFKD